MLPNVLKCFQLNLKVWSCKIINPWKVFRDELFYHHSTNLSQSFQTPVGFNLYQILLSCCNHLATVKYIHHKLKISKYWWSSISGLNLSVSYVVTEQKLCAQLRVAAIWDYMCRAWNVKWAVKRQPPFILFMTSISQFYCLQKSAGELHAPVHEQ